LRLDERDERLAEQMIFLG